MNEFIHTFSVTTHIYNAQKDNLAAAFGEHFFYNSGEKHYVLSKYAKDGIRVEIKFNPEKEKKYDKKHRDCKVEMIITPAKLLYPNQPMEKLYSPSEYEEACIRLEKIIREIELLSGVNLWEEVKLKRIDVSKDVETPSDEYSREVIRMAKLALYKTGYHIWRPTLEEIEDKDWFEEDSIFFNNHNQEVGAKIYNKLTDMKNLNYDTTGIQGLLRFELTLKRKFLKSLSLLTGDYLSFSDLATIVSTVLLSGSELMQKHVVSPLWSGVMLSKNLQKKYIKCYCKSKNSKYRKMMSYRRQCNRSGVYQDPKMEEYFGEIGLSPLCVEDEMQYLTSFGELLEGTRNERIARFMKFQKEVF